ncbi:unnamed protein product [Ambrosiozyma monospora]|uniref:Unnamed protein product n=1 Tax=Ambrosiozyma monospora TaxID=43982 RepID=A0ACB5TPG7_AMBMO|nr:unnamed protein product [Ambrosiozyma monospora]
MSFLEHKTIIKEGDLVLAFIGRDNLKPIYVTPGQAVNTRYGTFAHESMIGLPYGSQITSGKGYGFIYLLHPTPELWTISLPHRTQIVYTPDSSYIIQRLNVISGSKVIESGTGSGSFTHAFARTCGSKGKVFSYEFHEPRYLQAKNEFEGHGLTNVHLTHRDVCANGFDVKDLQTDEPFYADVDAVFLDLPSPWEAIPHLQSVIAKDRAVGICCFSPCIEQVTKTIEALQKHGWIDIEMTEIAGKKWDSRKEMIREVDDAVERLKDIQKRQAEGIEKKKAWIEMNKKQKEKDVANGVPLDERKRAAQEHIAENKRKKQQTERDYGFNPWVN